ncbi:UDP-N-acetylmuramate--L-alanine ligase [Malonomonas rubra DSM 5091]|uniref:UDP-N-acetylmuramate--L-alanine ligase n=1 Tax=Malonomonas rubra DSM 5091 TaxID=1122189 RepID=A0A1M6E5F0_MALRU|nr:UDP-N-acetylmuramate--L-alanine ligase [Malonomonas rubra]SHI80784.1 UDP-N-acetylmuramate--L-alanine ligase [Malonomonas rubra DSM 5091]
MYGRIKKIHFIGIGGIGMSGIAELLLNQGYRVSGSDLRESDTTRRLAELGGEIVIGHQAENIVECDVVVTSTAVKADNPEVVEAHRQHVAVIPRAEMLAELMRMKYGIAIAGTHGKTTTTSMMSLVLHHAGIDPTAVIGGKLDAFGSNAKLGRGKFLVAEADESDGSFMHLSPTIAVVTNIDEDHLDFYSGLDEIKQIFIDFINKVPFYGRAVLCLDDPNIQDILPEVKKRYLTYGFTSQADFHAAEVQHRQGRTSFTAFFQGEELGRVSFRMPGRHNVLNALAVIAVAHELGVPFQTIIGGFRNFGGLQRRFQLRDEVDGVMIVDDYGHHPAEIKATLSAAKTGWNKRVIAVFQPHRYSRTSALFEDFKTAFYQADIVVVADVYAAGEDPIEGATGDALAQGIIDHGHKETYYRGSFKEITDLLGELAQPGDLVVTLGAGSINQVCPMLADQLRAGGMRK